VPPGICLSGCCSAGVPCSSCSTGNAPTCLNVAISGVTEGTCGCARCSELNTTWSLTNTLSGGCTWTHNLCSAESPYNICAYYSGSTLTAGFSSITAALTFVSGTTYRLTVTLTGGGGTTIWRKDFTSGKPDCEAWAGESIPFISSTANANFTCAFASSTLTVTAATSGCDSGTACSTKDGCNRCEGLDNPDEIELEIGNTWTEVNDCGGTNIMTCNEAVGTFVLTKTSECDYAYAFPLDNCCEWSSVRVRIIRESIFSNNIQIEVFLTSGNCAGGGSDNSQNFFWVNTYSSTATCLQVDCRTLLESGLAVAFSSGNSPPVGRIKRCNWDGTTVTVTGIYN
jgi:hypothetical protein